VTEASLDRVARLEMSIISWASIRPDIPLPSQIVSMGDRPDVPHQTRSVLRDVVSHNGMQPVMSSSPRVSPITTSLPHSPFLSNRVRSLVELN